MRSGFLCVFLASLPLAARSAEAPKPVSVEIDWAKLPANQWVEISQARKLPMQNCSLWYMEATDEFLCWGRIGGHRYESKRYEIQSLSLRDDAPEWRDSLPNGKEKTWANGKFPNWGCGCHRLRYKPDRPWRKDVRDRWVGASAKINAVSFVTTEDVLRPTRCMTFHQGAYDSKRHRLVYYLGRKTFAYDPAKRLWTNLDAPPPTACDALVWASMCYDPVGDRIVLFGGGYALNPWGGARTWLFDCAKNAWAAAEVKDGVEPPLRCNARLVYDPEHKVMVLFGGDAQDRLLADTWVFDPAALTWKNASPAQSPPPAPFVMACYLGKARSVFVALPSRYMGRGKHRRGTVWSYDVAGNAWSALPGELPPVAMEWASMDYSPKRDAVILSSPGRGTWVYRLDRSVPWDVKRKMVPPGTQRIKQAGQMKGLASGPETDREQRKKELRDLPANTVVEVHYPGRLTSKTWSSATIDTHRGVVIYTGGGHSGYTGNDIAQYDIAANRWALDAPPCQMPYPRAFNATLFGWCYHGRPQSQHTYRWYAYDPLSRTMVYCARAAGPHNGFTVIPAEGDAPFVYDSKKHRDWTWIYDPVKNVRYPPVFERPFRNSWALALCGTPKGVFAKSGGALFLGQVSVQAGRADIRWKPVDKGAPSGSGEFQPLAYDSKRNRLLFAGQRKGEPVRVWHHPLEAGPWEEIEATTPTKHMSREIVYDAVNDCLVSMPERRCMVFGLEERKWRELDVKMPGGGSRYGTECAMVYDPVHRLCVMLIPKSFSGEMGVYLLRYDPKTAEYK